MIAHAMSIRKNIRVVSVRSGYSSNYTYETEKTSLANGGPNKLTCQLSCKAGGLQKRRALKCYWHSEFHHIIERPFPFKKADFPGWKSAFFYFLIEKNMLIIPIIRFSHTFYTCIQLGAFCTFFGIFTWNGIFEEKKPKKWGPENERVTKKVHFYWKIIAEKFGRTGKK